MQSHNVPMALFVWMVVQDLGRVMFRSVSTTLGGGYVKEVGVLLTLK